MKRTAAYMEPMALKRSRAEVLRENKDHSQIFFFLQTRRFRVFSRLLAEVPEDGSEDEGDDGGEEEASGGVGGVPPVGLVLLPEAGHALRDKGLRELRGEIEVIRAEGWRAQLADQLFVPLVEIRVPVQFREVHPENFFLGRGR